jgi:excisionase family DNA binding protein
VLTAKQAADRVGVSDSLIYEWCAQGILPHYRFGRNGRRGKILIDEAELDAFMAAHRQAGRPQAEAPPLKHIRLNHG